MQKGIWFALCVGLLALWGCGPVISMEIRAEATPIPGFTEVRKNPEAFRNKTIIIGGRVISTLNHEDESTTLLVLDVPLDAGERPETGEQSEGRFMVETPQFLDPVIYARGREVTVAGVVTGVKTANVGQTRYPYVVLKARQIYLWPRRTPRYLMPDYPYWWTPDWDDRFWNPPWWGPAFDGRY